MADEASGRLCTSKRRVEASLWWVDGPTTKAEEEDVAAKAERAMQVNFMVVVAC